MRHNPSALIRDDDAGSDLCQACAHPLSGHDVIGLRWCEETELGIGRRVCICSGAVAEPVSSPPTGQSWGSYAEEVPS